MSNKKQSSVDWLINQALEWSKEIGTGCHYMKFPSEALEQAKAMHKEECIKYYVDGIDYGDKGEHIRESLIQIAEKIYNETFNNNEQQ